MLPYGGTEIQYDYLHKYGDRNLLELVQITTSVPEKEPLHPLRPNILWIKNSYDQPNLAPWFTKKENHKKYDWYVFNSHWTYEKYRYFFNVPDTRSVVIKNGIDYEELKLKKDYLHLNFDTSDVIFSKSFITSSIKNDISSDTSSLKQIMLVFPTPSSLIPSQTT